MVVVLPCTPAPPPHVDAPPAVLQSWLARCHAFAALTSLGGVPSAVVPVGELPNGGGPLAVGLFGHSRSDQRLLTVAKRLASHAQVSQAVRGCGEWDCVLGLGSCQFLLLLLPPFTAPTASRMQQWGAQQSVG